MGKPIWDAGGVGLALADVGYHVQPGSPQPRMLQHSVPGVDGVYVGLLGVGPRYWYGRGIIETAKVATEALASQDVKDAILAAQSLVAVEVKSYTDTTTDVYSNCVILSYQQAGPIITSPAPGGEFTGRCAVTFIIMQQDPS